MPGPIAATSASARMSRGNARNTSATRISAASATPPRNPAAQPMTSPAAGTVSAISATTASVARLP